MTQTGFIPDGYEITKTIPEKIGVHASVEITFRPATSRERTKLFDRWGKRDADEKSDKQVDFLLDHVSEWDYKHPETGEVLPVEKNTFEKTTFDLFDSMINVVCGVAQELEDSQGN